MISAVKHTGLFSLKKIYSAVILVLCCTVVKAQPTNNNVNDSSGKKNALAFYHSIAPAKVKPAYQHIDYTRPNNQLMSWPGYPLTAIEIERRDKASEQENKIGNVIAKDIITGLLKKKTKVAGIPKF